LVWSQQPSMVMLIAKITFLMRLAPKFRQSPSDLTIGQLRGSQL